MREVAAPWKECSVVEERLRFVARLLDGEAMSDVCRAFGISRKTGYRVHHSGGLFFEQFQSVDATFGSEMCPTCVAQSRESARRLAVFCGFSMCWGKLEGEGNRSQLIIH